MYRESEQHPNTAGMSPLFFSSKYVLIRPIKFASVSPFTNFLPQENRQRVSTARPPDIHDSPNKRVRLSHSGILTCLTILQAIVYAHIACHLRPPLQVRQYRAHPIHSVLRIQAHRRANGPQRRRAVVRALVFRQSSLIGRSGRSCVN